MSQKVITLSSDEDSSSSHKHNAEAPGWMTKESSHFLPQIIGISSLAFGNPLQIPTPKITCKTLSKNTKGLNAGSSCVIDLDDSPSLNVVDVEQQLEDGVADQRDVVDACVTIIEENGAGKSNPSENNKGKYNDKFPAVPSPNKLNDALKPAETQVHELALFQKLVKLCVNLEAVPTDREKLKGKMERAITRTDTEYIKSAAFSELLICQMSKLHKDKKKLYFCVKEVLDQLKEHKAGRRIVLTAVAHNEENSDNIKRLQNQEEDSYADDIRDDVERGVSTLKENSDVIKLSRTLEKLSRKIKKLGESEVDLKDDYDSNFLRMRRYEDRFAKVNMKLCELTGQPMHLGFLSKRKIRYSGTSNAAVNGLLEEWLNKRRIFPDFSDVHQLIKDNAESLHLSMAPERLRDLATEAFRAIGKQLQKRRKLDDFDTIQAYADASDDPAANDPELETALRNNRREFLKRTDELCNTFCQRQTDENVEPVEVSDNAPTSEDEDDEEKEKDSDREASMADPMENIDVNTNPTRKETKNGYKNCKSKWLRDKKKVGENRNNDRLELFDGSSKASSTSCQEYKMADVPEMPAVIVEKTTDPNPVQPDKMSELIEGKHNSNSRSETQDLVLEWQSDSTVQKNVRCSVSSEVPEIILEEPADSWQGPQVCSSTWKIFEPPSCSETIFDPRNKNNRGIIKSLTHTEKVPTLNRENILWAGPKSTHSSLVLSKNSKGDANENGDFVIMEGNAPLLKPARKRRFETVHPSSSLVSSPEKLKKRQLNKFSNGIGDIRLNPYQRNLEVVRRSVNKANNNYSARKSRNSVSNRIREAPVGPSSLIPICLITQPRTVRRSSSGPEDGPSLVTVKRRKTVFGDENTRPKPDDNECVVVDEKPPVVQINNFTFQLFEQSRSIFKDLQNYGRDLFKDKVKKSLPTCKDISNFRTKKRLKPLIKHQCLNKISFPVRSHGTGVSNGENSQDQAAQQDRGEKEQPSRSDSGNGTTESNGSSSGDKDPNDNENGGNERHGACNAEADYTEGIEEEEEDDADNDQSDDRIVDAVTTSGVEDLMDALTGGVSLEFTYGEAIDQETFDNEIDNSADESRSSGDEKTIDEDIVPPDDSELAESRGNGGFAHDDIDEHGNLVGGDNEHGGGEPSESEAYDDANIGEQDHNFGCPNEFEKVDPLESYASQVVVGGSENESIYENASIELSNGNMVNERLCPNAGEDVEETNNDDIRMDANSVEKEKEDTSIDLNEMKSDGKSDVDSEKKAEIFSEAPGENENVGNSTIETLISPVEVHTEDTNEVVPKADETEPELGHETQMEVSTDNLGTTLEKERSDFDKHLTDGVQTNTSDGEQNSSTERHEVSSYENAKDVSEAENKLVNDDSSITYSANECSPSHENDSNKPQREMPPENNLNQHEDDAENLLQDFSGGNILIADVREVEKSEFEQATTFLSNIPNPNNDLCFGDIQDPPGNTEDDIEIIAESLSTVPIPKQRPSQDLTPDERVKRFLQNVPGSIEITLKRKRAVSDETKQAIERLKKLKGVSATRVQPDEPEILVLPTVPIARVSQPPRRTNLMTQTRHPIPSRQARTNTVPQFPTTPLSQQRFNSGTHNTRPNTFSLNPRAKGIILRGNIVRPGQRPNGIPILRPRLPMPRARGPSVPFQLPRPRGNMFPSFPMPNGFPRVPGRQAAGSPMVLSVRGNLRSSTRGRGTRGRASTRGRPAAAQGKVGAVQCVDLE